MKTKPIGISGEKLAQYIETLDALFKTEDSPLLENCENDADCETLTFKWVDAEGLQFETVIPYHHLAEATVDELGRIHVLSQGGHNEIITLFEFSKIQFDPDDVK